MADSEGEHHVPNEEEQKAIESSQSEARSGSESSEEEGNGSDNKKGSQGPAAKSDSKVTKTKKLAGARQQPNKQINSRQEKPRNRMTASKIANLKAKFKWLVLDANDKNQCRCRICQTQMWLTVFHVKTHNASRKHARGLKRQKPNTTKNAEPSVSTNSEAAPSNAKVQEPGLEMDMDSDTDMSMRSDGSMAEPPAKRLRKRIVRTNQMTMDEERFQDKFSFSIDNFNRPEIDKFCSALDNFNRLPTEEGEGAMGHGNNTGQPSEPRHALDLFFDSIVPTMKSLPLDLAAEGKASIMQVVCGLEIQAMHRDSAKVASPVSNPDPRTRFAAPPAAAGSTPAAPSVQATTIQDDDNNNVESTQNKSASGATTASLANIGNPQDLPGNTRRIPRFFHVKLPDLYDPNSFKFVPLRNLLKRNGNGGP